MGDLFQFKISKEEYSALINIKGLPESAHNMVISASANSGTLKGTYEAFSELLDTIYEEIDYELSTKKNLRILEKLSSRLASKENPYEPEI